MKCILACATPVKEGRIDEYSLRKIVRYAVDNGVDGIFAPSYTGSFHLMTPNQRKDVIGTVADELRLLKKKDPTIKTKFYAGVTGESEKETLENLYFANEAGTDFVIVAPLYYKRNRELRKHLEKLGNESETGLFLYNNPRLSRKPTLHKNIMYGSQGMEKISRNPKIFGMKNSGKYTEKYIEAFLKNRKRREFEIFEGKEERWLNGSFTITDGMVSGTANVLPSVMKGLTGPELKPSYREAYIFFTKTHSGSLYSEKTISVLETCLQELGLCDYLLKEEPSLTDLEKERYIRKINTLLREGLIG